jgi:hypothetical protein
MRHLLRGGSGAKRDINCPGNIKKSEGIPRRPAGAAAIDGSMHHGVMELCQIDAITPDDVLAKGYTYTEDGVERVFTEDDRDTSNIAHSAMEAIFDDYDIDEVMIEPFVQFIPDLSGGSIDVLGLSADRKTIVLADYKFGQVKVEVKENDQLSVYAISSRVDPQTADMWSDVETILFTVIQPRVKGVFSVWETTPKWLDKFEKRYAAAIKQDNINPGSWCKYCPAEPYCEEKRGAVMGANLLGARLQKELQAGADMIEEVDAWLKSVKEEMYLQLSRGVSVKGWKIIDKRATRKWVNEEAMVDALEKHLGVKDIYKSTILTPPQMEKLVKKNKVDLDLDEFIVSVSSGTTLAPEDHASPAVIVSDVQGELKDIMK